jgi:hypothetical protein
MPRRKKRKKKEKAINPPTPCISPLNNPKKKGKGKRKEKE